MRLNTKQFNAFKAIFETYEKDGFCAGIDKLMTLVKQKHITSEDGEMILMEIMKGVSDEESSESKTA